MIGLVGRGIDGRRANKRILREAEELRERERAHAREGGGLNRQQDHLWYNFFLGVTESYCSKILGTTKRGWFGLEDDSVESSSIEDKPCLVYLFETVS